MQNQKLSKNVYLEKMCSIIQ